MIFAQTKSKKYKEFTLEKGKRSKLLTERERDRVGQMAQLLRSKLLISKRERQSGKTGTTFEQTA